MQADTAIVLYNIVAGCFVGTWFVLGVGGGLFFHLGKDAALKRRWFPRYAVLAGVLFVLFASLLTGLSSGSPAGLGSLVFLIPAAAVIAFLNIKTYKFCDECGATLYNWTWFAPMRFCPKCGAPLEPKPKRLDDPLG